MTDDPVTRAHRALPGAPRQIQPAGPLLNHDNNRLARAHEVLEKPLPQTHAAASPVNKPSAKLMCLPATCSATARRSYILIAEQRDDRLLILRHEMPQARNSGDLSQSSLLSGQYKMEFPKGWTCPLCRSSDRIWLCNCAAFFGAIHCCGNSDGRYHCACGGFEYRTFHQAEKVDVRGASAVTPNKTKS